MPRVLVVEDHADIRALLRALLTGSGHEVHEVERGDLALDAALEVLPDVVLLDLGLPGLDGMEVLPLLKAHPELAHVPVLIVTAWDDAERVRTALELGACDYVRKPFEAPELLARVDAAARAKHEHDVLQSAALTDALTGVPNRRALNLELERFQARADRDETTFSMLLVDVDHFKNINDACGHLAGDRVLERLALLLRDRARTGDFVGRWGGEEFMILAHDTDENGAEVLAGGIRRAVALARLAEAGMPGPVTVSIGVATSSTDSLDELAERADRALYNAKSAGRNTVRLASTPPRLRAA